MQRLRLIGDIPRLRQAGKLRGPVQKRAASAEAGRRGDYFFHLEVFDRLRLNAKKRTKLQRLR